MIEVMMHNAEASPSPDEYLRRYRDLLVKKLPAIVEEAKSWGQAAQNTAESLRTGTGFLAKRVLERYRVALLSDSEVQQLRQEMFAMIRDRVGVPLSEMIEADMSPFEDCPDIEAIQPEVDPEGFAMKMAEQMLAVQIYQTEMRIIADSLQAEGLGERIKSSWLGRLSGGAAKSVREFRAQLLAKPGSLVDQEQQVVVNQARAFLAWLLDVDNLKRVVTSAGPLFPVQYLASVGLKHVRDEVSRGIEQLADVVARSTFVSNGGPIEFLHHNARVKTAMGVVALLVTFVVADASDLGGEAVGQVILQPEEASLVSADTVDISGELMERSDLSGDVFRATIKKFGKFLGKLGVRK